MKRFKPISRNERDHVDDSQGAFCNIGYRRGYLRAPEQPRALMARSDRHELPATTAGRPLAACSLAMLVLLKVDGAMASTWRVAPP